MRVEAVVEYVSLNNFLSKVADWIQLYGDSLQPFSIF